MSSPLQRIAKFSALALLSSTLFGCGGAETAAKSDMADATTAVVADAVADAGPDRVKDELSAATETLQNAVAGAEVEVAGAEVEVAGAEVEVAGAEAEVAGAEAEVAGAEAMTGIAQPDLAAGEATYGRFCFSCHAAGVAGAPKLGDGEDWAPRIAKGLDMLVATSIEGIPPGMPAKGLCMSCTEEDMRNTVAWMIAQ